MYDVKAQRDISILSGRWKEGKYGLMYSDRVRLNGNEVKLIIQNTPTKIDRKLVDTILQLWQIHSKHTLQDGTYIGKPQKFNAEKAPNIVQMNWVEIFRELGIQDSPQNKGRVKKSLDNLRSLTIIGTDGTTVYDYTVISGKEINYENDTIDVELSQMFLRRFASKNVRPQFLDKIRAVEDKVANAGSLAKYLIAYGAGGDRLPKSKVKIKDIMRNQGLNNSKTDKQLLQRQVKAIEEIFKVTAKYLDRSKYIRFTDIERAEIKVNKEDIVDDSSDFAPYCDNTIKTEIKTGLDRNGQEF